MSVTPAEVERVYFFSGLSICAVFAALDFGGALPPTISSWGVIIGVVLGLVNLRFWVLFVSRLTTHAATAEMPPHGPPIGRLLVLKLVCLGLAFGYFFARRPEWVLSFVIGVLLFVMAGSLLILFISYNKG
ncbi:MAG: hypothetical protein KDD44_04280 [Bdellovibrionales bacterium]|nr:hypothetical protein [Bdellovibrionales bacterium]